MRFLLAEDEVRIAQSLKKGLELEGFHVDITHDGEEALSFALSQEYDICIFDIMMPKMDGIALTQELRSHKISTPILLLTAKGQVHEKVLGLDSGADDYLVKPFAFEELLARVRALVRRPSLLHAEVLEYADLQVFPQSSRVVRAGKEIALSSKEFALLTYFLHHPDRVFSKQHLIDKVWEYDSDVLPNTVEVFVRHLREKLEKPFPDSPPLITTLRGFGYRFGA